MSLETIASSGELVPIVFIAGLMLLGLTWTIGLLTIGFVKALRGSGSRNPRLDEEETRAYQGLERGFRRMEERVESLETLIIDKSRTSEFEKKLNN